MAAPSQVCHTAMYSDTLLDLDMSAQVGKARTTERATGRTRLTREEQRAVTRARLLASAAKVFAERGFYGASVEEIADRAGFTRGAFYSNFETKADLFLALLDEHIGKEMRTLEDALAQDPSAQAFLERLSTRSRRRAEPRE